MKNHLTIEEKIKQQIMIEEDKKVISSILDNLAVVFQPKLNKEVNFIKY